MSENSTPAERPGTVTAAAVLTGLQGLVAAGLGGYMLLLVATGDPGDPMQAVVGAITVLALALVPLAAGHGLWRLRSWSRGPAVITQLLMLPVAGTLAGSGGAWPAAAVALGGTALAVLVCLMNRTSAQALHIGARGV
ncbi:hypothetical protein MTQ13_05300 [Streptomyces sp. XM4011]|uniref:hypothetical protein n=1 Tax=Streptomyces TaxID=1883 RepID=UPI001FFB283F|nr:hypothetical protein [Streptomyces sp. XM4011]MCK1813697.1 hypothetical protein [Streptomyces sp. XM4011]